MTTEMVSRQADSETGGPGSQRTMRERKFGESLSWRRSQVRAQAGQTRQRRNATQRNRDLGDLADSSEGGV